MTELRSARMNLGGGSSLKVAAIRTKKRATDTRKNSKKTLKIRESVAKKFKMMHYLNLLMK